MNITGIDKIVYGVEDLGECARFFNDWGLAQRDADVDGPRFETLDGSEVVLHEAGSSYLPPAMEAGSTLRRVVWGVQSKADLDAVRARFAGEKSFGEEADGPSVTDPNGLRLSFRVTRRRPVEAKSSPVNTADATQRVNRRSTVYERAQPVRIGHVVLFSPDVRRAVAFYEQHFGFLVSDCYPDVGYFMRCAPEGGHHNLFMLQTPDRKQGLNHVAFTVRDIHEVFGGGLHISRCGWNTQIGPGRHPISSAYFWYVHNPAGALAEYYADEDYCTADWEPQEWERLSENYAEWAIAGGIDGKTRRQSRE